MLLYHPYSLCPFNICDNIKVSITPRNFHLLRANRDSKKSDPENLLINFPLQKKDIKSLLNNLSSVAIKSVPINCALMISQFCREKEIWQNKNFVPPTHPQQQPHVQQQQPDNGFFGGNKIVAPENSNEVSY